MSLHNRYYVHTNHQGSVVALTSSTGVIVQQYAYDSFGVPYVKSGSGVNTVYTLISSYTGSLHENTRLYTSREYDKELNLYFLRARYYNPTTGKFISRDPIGQNDQINLYTYVGNSPYMFVDLFGKEGKPVGFFRSAWNKVKDIGKQIKDGAIQGDYIENPTGWNTVGQIGVGVVPVVGQVGDARDIKAALENCEAGIDCGSRIGWSVASVLPFVGELRKLKQIRKILDNPEVKNTMKRIEDGNTKIDGANPRNLEDGGTFRNDQGLLPKHEKGYYQEWTVETPGAANRGERRIITGKNGEMYYTDVHYKNFERIK